MRLSGEIMREMGGQFWNRTEWKLEVADEHDQVLFSQHFSAEEGRTLAEPRPDPQTP